MALKISSVLLKELHEHIESAHPGEGAGFLLGEDTGGARIVRALVPLSNAREESARFNRFLLTAEDYLKGEMAADESGLSLLGVFHSHPDCVNVPSEYDREWAMPWFSYIISRVDGGAPAHTVSDLSWRLRDDREGYDEETLIVTK